LEIIYVNGENLNSSNGLFTEWKNAIINTNASSYTTIFATDDNHSRFTEDEIKIALRNHIDHHTQDEIGPYWAGKPQVMFEDAREVCQGEGGALVSIQTQAEADLIMRMIYEFGERMEDLDDGNVQRDYTHNNYWIGADGSAPIGAAPNNGKWLDGSDWTYWNWNSESNQPNGEKDVFDFENVQYCGVGLDCCLRGGPNEKHCFNPTPASSDDVKPEGLVYLDMCADKDFSETATQCWNDEGNYESEKQMYTNQRLWDDFDTTDKLADHLVVANYVCWMRCDFGQWYSEEVSKER